ncbi:MAG: 5-formyltetrahydrofolate cyclo-ligase [Phycisphaerales bacterium]
MALTKAHLRNTLKSALALMSDEQRDQQTRLLIEQIAGSDLYRSATTILAYASLPSEISIDSLINHALSGDKVVCIPAVDWDQKMMHAVSIRSLDKDLQTGRYGLRSPCTSCKPIPAHEISLALIPGLGFDPSGRRLGRGAGFYDRWIGDRLKHGNPLSLVGVCFDEQLVERIPTDPHDQPMDRVVTPTAQYVREHG